MFLQGSFQSWSISARRQSSLITQGWPIERWLLFTENKKQFTFHSVFTPLHMSDHGFLMVKMQVTSGLFKNFKSVPLFMFALCSWLIEVWIKTSCTSANTLLISFFTHLVKDLLVLITEGVHLCIIPVTALHHRIDVYRPDSAIHRVWCETIKLRVISHFTAHYKKKTSLRLLWILCGWSCIQ